jgi:hypothetical protein
MPSKTDSSRYHPKQVSHYYKLSKVEKELPILWRPLISACLVIMLAASGCVPEDNCRILQNTGPVVRILFVGNSYTYVNDLPGMFTKLACSGGHQVETGMAAEGGWTLAQHASSSPTLDKIHFQKWDFIILQEQSEIPAIQDSRIQTMYPAVRQLVHTIRASGAQPLLFLTWGHQNGDATFGLVTYSDMQAQLSAGYMGIAQELNVPVVPVGTAWLKGVTQANPLNLWQSDGSHPTEQGTYLAACVFYAAIFHQTPVGLGYLAGVDPATAQTLQTLAGETTPK